MLQTFSLISDINKANLTKELQCFLPNPPIMRPIILWNMDFFKINFQFSHVYLFIAIYHAWMAIIIIVLCNTDWLYWFLICLPTFG